MILVLVTVLFVILDKIFLFFILELAILLGSLELLHIVNPRGGSLFNFSGIAGGMLIGLGFYLNNPAPFLVIPLLVILSLQLIGRRSYTIGSTGNVILGVLYPALFLSYIIPLRRMGVGYALMPLLYTWVFDTSAYLIGSRFGRRKIAPSVSPGKSLEGILGGISFSVVAGILAKLSFAQFLSIPHALLLGISIPLIGQLGDLFESLVKRSAELKDSSSLLPGHGGVLDRLDSLIFTIPATYYYFQCFFLG